MKTLAKICFLCFEKLVGAGEYHPRCSRKFFGINNAPLLEYNLQDMDKLAVAVIRTHTTIPGVQAKLSLDWENVDHKKPKEGKNSRLTIVGLWGRYILKPPTTRFPHLPEVENATMQLARIYGIKTVPNGLIRLRSGELAYITQRIDRNEKKKIAMEDFCQLTERLTEDKYKGSMEQVGKVLRQYSTNPGLDAVDLFNRTLFCYLIGNADMHLKNFSLWRPTETEIILSPAYDLVATKIILPSDNEETALPINGKKKNLRQKDFNSFADSLGLVQKVRSNSYAQAQEALPKMLARLSQSLLTASMLKDFKCLIQDRYRAIQL